MSLESVRPKDAPSAEGSRDGTLLERIPASREWIKPVLVVGILFILPVSVLIWINDRIHRDQWEESARENAEQLNQIVAHFSRLAQPATYFHEAVLRVKRALIWGQNPAPYLSLLPSNVVKLYSFDARGKRTRIPGFDEGLKNVSEQCLEFIRKSARQTGWQMTLKERSRAESFFGNSNVIETIAWNPGKLISLDFFGLPKTMGVFPFRDRKRRAGFILVSIENLKISHFDLAKQALRKIKKLAGQEFDFGFLDLGNQHPDQTLGMEKIPGFVRQKMTSASGEPLFSYERSIWNLSVLSRKFLLFGRCAEIRPLAPFLKRQGSFLAGGAAFFLLILLLQTFWIKRGVSVRIQVLVLFSLAGAGSILTLFGFARAYIEIRQKTLLRERYVQTREILEKIDNSFSFFQGGLAQWYQSLGRRICAEIGGSSSPRSQSGIAKNRALALIQKLPKSLAVMVFNEKGEIVLRRASEAESSLATLYGKDYLKGGSRIGILTMKCFNAVIMDGGNSQVLENEKDSPIIKKSARKLYDNLGKIYDIAFGKGKFSVFMDFFLDEGGFARGGIWIIHVEDMIERSFLNIIRKRHKRFDFPVFSRNYSLRLVPLKQTGFQPRKNKLLPWNEIHDFHDLISQLKIPVFRKLSLRSHPILLSGIPGKKLQEYNLVLITSLTSLEREATALFRGFLGFSFLIIIFAISLSFVFSEMLLEPIQRLTEGLTHLSESHFSTPVKIRTGDELQLVSDGINEIFEEMGELSIAKSIQERLFPSEPLCLMNWTSRGWSRSHSEIGGEIFDYLGLPQDRILIWMAGVPGHSIESALVLAMAKMAARTLVDLKIDDSSALYKELNLNLREKTKGFEGGSLLVGVFDQKSGVVEMTGHGKFMIGKTGFEGETGEASNGSTESFLLSSERSDAVNVPENFSWEGPLLSGSRLFIFSKGCWDADQPPGSTLKAMNELLSKLSGPNCQTGNGEIWGHLAIHNPSKTRHESQTILMLEGKESSI